MDVSAPQKRHQYIHVQQERPQSRSSSMASVCSKVMIGESFGRTTIGIPFLISIAIGRRSPCRTNSPSASPREIFFTAATDRALHIYRQAN